MLSGVHTSIELTRASPEFALVANAAADGVKPKFVINDARLSVRRVKINPEIMYEHEKSLERQNAIYPFPQKAVKIFSAAAGSQTFTKEDVFGGKVPKLMIVALTSAPAYNGTYANNPFNF